MKKKNPQIILVDHFKLFIKASQTGRRKTPTGKRLSTGTLKNYNYTLNLLVEFERTKKIILRIQLLHRAPLPLLQKEKTYWSKFVQQFSNFLFKEKKYFDNYASNVFKIIKAFFNYLQSEKGLSIGNYHKSFRAPSPISTPVVLLPEQLSYLITNVEFKSKLSPSLQRARHIFVFGCTVALRITDLMSLKKNSIVYTEKEAYLLLQTRKTGAVVKVPLPDYALEITDYYKKRAGRYLLPRLSGTNINKQVKKLIEKAGWSYELPKTITREGKIIELKKPNGDSWRFHDHITAHTMRRTAITTLLILGVSEIVVRKISGHAPGSKEFYRYVAIAQDYLNEEVKKAFTKLVTIPAPAPADRPL